MVKRAIFESWQPFVEDDRRITMDSALYKKWSVISLGNMYSKVVTRIQMYLGPFHIHNCICIMSAIEKSIVPLGFEFNFPSISPAV